MDGLVCVCHLPLTYLLTYLGKPWTASFASATYLRRVYPMFALRPNATRTRCARRLLQVAGTLMQRGHWEVYTYIHTYTHTHIHTYTHTYIHTYVRSCSAAIGRWVLATGHPLPCLA